MADYSKSINEPETRLLTVPLITLFNQRLNRQPIIDQPHQSLDELIMT